MTYVDKTVMKFEHKIVNITGVELYTRRETFRVKNLHIMPSERNSVNLTVIINSVIIN